MEKTPETTEGNLHIYFCGSIRGGRSDVSLYSRLIEMLEGHGNVLTEHVGAEDVEATETEMTDTAIHDQDLAWLREADIVVAEVTVPSLGVGYEIGKATAWEKPVLCLYRPSGDHELSAMIRGSPERVVDYSDPVELESVFHEFIAQQR